MNIALPVLGGLGLFLYGMNLMGTGLEKTAGDRLKRLIEILTSNRLMGVIVGIVVTVLIQSSSATTIMVVGFVNAGIMGLSQAVGVIMGANIGTTITSQLIAFDLTGISPLVIAVGVAMWMISSNKRSKSVAEILIGFGILFTGMDMMTAGLAPLNESEAFRSLIINLDNPFIGVLVGLVLTTLVQSSSASIGLLQALGAQGLISLNMAIPVLYGDNIGTTTTTLISSIGANKTAKRAAWIHFIFNLTGTLIFMTILKKPVTRLSIMMSPDNVRRQIANAHTLFNIVNVIILFPFAGLFVKIVKRIIPGDEKLEGELAVNHLDPRIIETPSIALGHVINEVDRMGYKVADNLLLAGKAFKAADEKLLDEVFENEKIINKLEQDIIVYLVQLSNAPLSNEQHNEINTLINVVNDIERVGDHADNIAELTKEAMEDGVGFSGDAVEEFRIIFSKAHEVFDKALKAIKGADFDKAKEVLILEEEVDNLEKLYRNTHITRLSDQVCNPRSGVLFLDILSNLERVADHSYNIAMYVLDRGRKS